MPRVLTLPVLLSSCGRQATHIETLASTDSAPIGALEVRAPHTSEAMVCISNFDLEGDVSNCTKLGIHGGDIKTLRSNTVGDLIVINLDPMRSSVVKVGPGPAVLSTTIVAADYADLDPEPGMAWMVHVCGEYSIVKFYDLSFNTTISFIRIEEKHNIIDFSVWNGIPLLLTSDGRVRVPGVPHNVIANNQLRSASDIIWSLSATQDHETDEVSVKAASENGSYYDIDIKLNINVLNTKLLIETYMVEAGKSYEMNSCQW
jgi:hypothetical protein